MITSTQIRAARGALRWSAQDLADRAGVGIQTVKRFELAPSVPRSRSRTLDKVRLTLEAAGIEFVGTPEDGPGIRLRR
jgi:transcriptional regulator with XRE-family HTH domain